MTGAAVQRVREALAEHGCGPRGGNDKFRARCPVHESRGPTLAVSQGRTGAMLYCFAGCETDDVRAALGLAWSDLYDEPREADRQRWRPPSRPVPSPAEPAGQVIARAAVILATAEAMKESAVLRPRLTADECVSHAEWACRVEADEHFWRTLARYAALATDETYVRQAHQERQAWLDRQGPKPAHEQFVVLMTRAEDLERSPAVAATSGVLKERADVSGPQTAPRCRTAVPALAGPVPVRRRFRGVLTRLLAAEGDDRRRLLSWAAARAGELGIDRERAEAALFPAASRIGLVGEDGEEAMSAVIRDGHAAGARRVVRHG